MALVAEFTTARETFAIGRALADAGEQTIELERVIPTGESLVPYYWVWGDELAAYEDELSAEPGVEDVEAIARTDDGILYRVAWQNGTSATVHGLFDLDFTLLSGVCTADGWTFEIRFPSGEAATAFQHHLTERAIPHTLERVSQLTEPPGEATDRLTRRQREALVVAYDVGYFEEPRETSLSELADRLGISPSSASGRLRRGCATLVEDHLKDRSAESQSPLTALKRPK